MATAPQAKFCKGDQVLTDTGSNLFVLDIRLDAFEAFEYGLVDGAPFKKSLEPFWREDLLTLVERGIGPRYSRDDLVFDTGSGSLSAIGDVTMAVIDGERLYRYQVFTQTDPPTTQSADEDELTLPDGTIPPQPEICSDLPTCSLVERDAQGSGIVLSGAILGVGYFEPVALVATIINDDLRRDNIEWKASHGVIVDQSWNQCLWQAPSFETPAVVDIFIDGELQLACRSTYQTPSVFLTRPGAVTSLHIERAPRNSGDVLSSVSTVVEPGEVVNLVATILNDDGRRDNIQWVARHGTIEFQNWDQAVYTAPFVALFDAVDIIIDDTVQHGSRALFSVPAAAPTDPDETPLQDFLQIDWWKTWANRLSDVLTGTEETIPAGLRDIRNFLSGKADQTIDDLLGLPDLFKDSMEPSLTALGNELQANLLTNIVPIFGAQFNPIQAALEALPIPTPEELWAAFWSGAEDFLSPVVRTGVNLFLEGLEQAFAIIGAPLWARLQQVPDLPEWITSLVDQLVNPTSQAAALLGQSAGGSMMSGSITGIIAPELRQIQFWANQAVQNAILDFNTAAQANVRGFIGPQDFDSTLSKHGFHPDVRVVLQALATPRLDINSVNLQVLRWEMQQAAAGAGALSQELVSGFDSGVSPEAGDVLLSVLGYERRNREQLLDQRRQLPQIQDLIRFAVREAFSPELIGILQLDDDFPPEILPFTRGQGLPDEFTRMFWRAHWELPSIQQAFEMLHRSAFSPFFTGQDPSGSVAGEPTYSVIDDQGLDLLFREADILPFWRDRLKAISFSVITRVDVRRMYDMNILSLAQVEQTYRSLGYTPEDSANLTAFVERLAVQPRLTSRNTEARQQFRDGLIDEQRARELLAPLIQLPQELEEELITLRLDRQGTRLSRELTAWQAAFRKDLITEGQFRIELTRLDIPPEEIDFRVRITNIARVTEDPTPEQEELRAAGRGIVIRRFREGLVDQAQFALEMAALGYSDLQVAQFTTQADLEFDTNVNLDLLGAYRAGLRTGRLSEAEFRTNTGGLGIRSELIDAYVEFDQLRRKLEGLTQEEAELRAFGSGPVITRFQEGWTQQEEFQLEMESLGYTAAETDRYQLVADLRFDLDFKADSLTVLRSAFNRRIIDGNEFVGRLATLGMDQARAQVHLAREQLRLLDRADAPEIGPGEVGLPGG